MNWIDYRKILGIGFSDEEKFIAVKNCIVNKITFMSLLDNYTHDDYFRYCMLVGESYYGRNLNDLKKIMIQSFNSSRSMAELIAIYVAYVNSMKLYDDRTANFINLMQNILDSFKIAYDIKSDTDGFFIFPKGATELDYSLVSEPLIWLSDFPRSKKTLSIALRQYSESLFIRDCADNFRKALEEFFQEFFQNTKNLDNNVSNVSSYLKSQGASEEIVKVLVSLVNLFSMLNNKIAKHNDKVDSKYLEFIMYQTGLFIRMLIVVKRESV